jgi:transposase
LETLGHEVIVADPNFAPMYASRNRKVKTDKRDARALCEACHLGAYQAVHRVSDASRMLRKQLTGSAWPLCPLTPRDTTVPAAPPRLLPALG